MLGKRIEGILSERGRFRVWSADREVDYTAATLGTNDRYLAEQKILADLRETFDEIPPDRWLLRVHQVDPLIVSVFILWELFTREGAQAAIREARR